MRGLLRDRGRFFGVRSAVVATVALALLMAVGCLAGDLRTVPEPVNRPAAGSIAFRPVAADGVLGAAGLTTRFPFAPAQTAPAEETAVRLDPLPTPWAEPWDHDEIIHGMDRILRDAGVESLTARSRMTAHAIIASGWRQNVFHHNAWGVKRGSWDGPWFQKGTTEMTDIGFMTTIDDAQWRAFDSWQQAVDDYLSRITRKSERPSYRKAARFLFDKDFRSDDDYWMALSEGNYYTGQALTPERFGFLCYRVRQTVPRD